MLKWLIEKLLRPRWVVNEAGDLGLRVGGINFWYYKWPDPIIGGYKTWRVMRKREFGETVQSQLPLPLPVAADFVASQDESIALICPFCGDAHHHDGTGQREADCGRGRYVVKPRQN